MAVVSDGVREVHAISLTGSYETLCGVDGNDDGIGQTPSLSIPGEKITCAQCLLIWTEAMRYRKERRRWERRRHEHRLALPIACALGIEIGMRIAAMNCPECARCATHSYSDATTPGFFFDKCERHR
jgi:hypothetical protein